MHVRLPAYALGTAASANERQEAMSNPETPIPEADALQARHSGRAALFGHVPAREFVGTVRGLFWRALARAAAQTNLHLAQSTSRGYDTERGPDHRSIQYTRVVAQLSLALQRISVTEVTDNTDDTLHPSFMEEIDGFLAHVSADRPAKPASPAAQPAKTPSRAAQPAARTRAPDRAAPERPELDEPDPERGKPLSPEKQASILASFDRSKTPDDPRAWKAETRRHFGYALLTDAHHGEPGMETPPFPPGLSVLTDRDLLKNFRARVAAVREGDRNRPGAKPRSPGGPESISHKIEDRKRDDPPGGPRIYSL